MTTTVKGHRDLASSLFRARETFRWRAWVVCLWHYVSSSAVACCTAGP